MAEPTKKNKRIPKWFKFTSIISIAFVLFGLGTFMVLQKSEPANLNAVNAVIAKVDALYQLPTNERPALLTVTDKTKISSALAKKVQNGDKLLIYQKNQQAIIYRPSTNKIVGVIPVDIDDLPADNQK